MRSLIACALIVLGCSSSDPAPTSSSSDASVVEDSAASTDSMTSVETSTDTSTETGETGAADTWDGWAKADFFAKYCVECHGAGNTTRDYTKLADVKRDASLIACGVATTKLSGCGSFPPPKQFPIDNASKSNPKPSDAERARLVAWIQAGAS